MRSALLSSRKASVPIKWMGPLQRRIGFYRRVLPPPFFSICFFVGHFYSGDVGWLFTTKMKLKPWSNHELLPRQLPGNVSPDVIAQLDFSDKTTLVPVVWAIVLIEAVLITVVVVSRLMVRRLVIGRLFMDDGMPSPHLNWA